MARLVGNPYEGIDWESVAEHPAQLHTHTTHAPTDGHSGRDHPHEVIDAYREAGYSALVLNEHEYNVEETTWPWTALESLAGGQQYENRDPDDLGMTAIQGCELTPTLEGVEHDLLSLYADIADTDGWSLAETLSAIDDRDGLAVVPHPGRYHAPEEWKRYVEYFDEHPTLLGVEVYNAQGRYPESRAIWDELLAHYGPRRNVWGFACDDYHGTGDYGFDTSATILLLKERTDAAVRNAIEGGRSLVRHRVGEGMPPVIGAIDVDEDDGTIALSTRGADDVEWVSGGEVVATGETLAYGDREAIDGYARARLENRHGVTGTQPFTFARNEDRNEDRRRAASNR